MTSGNRFIVLGASLALVVIAAVALAIGNPFGAKSGGHALRPDDAQVLARGKQVYAAQCAACHGATLEGQPQWRERGPSGLLPAPPHDASGHTWHHADDVLFRITKHGVARAAGLKDYLSTMPIYEGVLSDDEIIAVLSWIKAQWPAPVRQRHDQINAQAPPAARP